jgi:hypothetical protein
MAKIKFNLLFLEVRKKGDEVEDEEDDDVMRSSVSQGRETVTLYTEELFLCTQYTQYSTLHIYLAGKTRGGEDMDCQHNTLGGSAGSHTSQLDLTMVSRASNKTGSFIQLFCDWGR